MTKKKGSAKGKKARSKRVSVRPPGSSTVSSVAPSASAEASASSSKQALPEPKARLAEKIDELDEKIEKKSKAARDGFASNPSIDDTSIPPVVEDEFFARGEAPARVSHSGASGAFEPIHPDARGSYRKATPEARARRGELAKYVKAAVAVSAAILVIGFVKLRFFSAPESDPNAARPAAAHVQEPAALPVAEPPASEARPSPPPGPTPGVAESPPDQKVDPAAATGDAGKALQAKTDEPEPKPTAVPETTAVPEKTAAQEKAAAQAALERNNAGAAISAGRRSVALDPTDAEAWLILGGAYQMQNRNGEAKAAFGSCVRQAKRGPVGECGQMIGQ